MVVKVWVDGTFYDSKKVAFNDLANGILDKLLKDGTALSYYRPRLEDEEMKGVAILLRDGVSVEERCDISADIRSLAHQLGVTDEELNYAGWDMGTDGEWIMKCTCPKDDMMKKGPSVFQKVCNRYSKIYEQLKKGKQCYEDNGVV